MTIYPYFIVVPKNEVWDYEFAFYQTRQRISPAENIIIEEVLEKEDKENSVVIKIGWQIFVKGKEPVRIMPAQIEKNNENLIKKDLEEFKEKHPEINSSDLQTFLLGWKAAQKSLIGAN